MHELVTDQGVLRVGADGVLEWFRGLDGHSTTRVLLWGCDATVAGTDDGRVLLTVTRKRLPVVRVELPADEEPAAHAIAAAIRDLSSSGA